MLYFFTPYSFSRKLFEAYDEYMNLVSDENDWVCFLDGDTAFLRSNFGHHIAQYIEKYPDTGLFTSYASRCAYPYQVPSGTDQSNVSIKYHKEKADLHNKFHHLDITELLKPVAGHLLVIKKSTWNLIRDNAADRCKHETIEAIDTAISKEIMAHKLPIRLMKGIYLLHYYRLVEGWRDASHIGYGKVLHIITACARPENLHQIAKSINIPRRSYRWHIVFDKPANSVPKELIPESAIVYYHQNANSVVGHSQRNYALAHITDGLIFFLDDDTIIHPDLYENIGWLNNDFIHFDQANPDDSKRIGGKVEVNHIDTGSAVATRQLIGETKFRTDLYNADGFFWKAVSNKATNSKYIPKLLSYYNYLTPIPSSNDETK